MIKYFFFFFIALLGFTIFNINKKHNKSILFNTLITIITLYFAIPFLQARVQTITFTLLLLEVYYWEKLYNNGNIKNTLIIIILAILIVNLHMPIWIMTIILSLPFLVECVLANFIKKINKPKNKKIIIMTFILLFLSGLISPFKLYPYTFFINCFKTSAYDIILEMQKTNIIQHRYQLILFLSSFILCYFKIAKIKFHDWLLIIGLFILGTLARRHMAYITIFLPTILNKSINYNFFKKKIMLKDMLLKNKYIIISCLCTIIIILSNGLIRNYHDFKKKDFEYEIMYRYPSRIVDYLHKNVDFNNRTPFFNKMNYGSYLALYDIPIFVDTRMEVYIKEFNGGQDIITDYLDACDENTYQNIFSKYKFEYAITYLKDTVYNFLSKDNNFTLLFEDEQYALFKRNALITNK